MYNVLAECTGVKRLVSLGIRDFSEEEFLMAEEDERILTGYDQELAAGKLEGRSFASMIDPLLKELPEEVYVSFDIDGLDPTLCPGTGTPVAGGLSFQEATFVLERLVKSGRRIIGFDLNEVAPSANNQEWDGNVGARMLYKLCGAFAISQKLSYLK
jgi:agmatinase